MSDDLPDDLPDDPAQLRALLRAERARRRQAEAHTGRLHDAGRIPQLNPNPVMQLNGAGELLFANPAAEALVRELTATGPSRVRPQLVQAATQALRTGQPSQHELTADRQHYLLFAVPVVEEGYTLLFLTNVTARRQAEQEVREQREFYEGILAHVPAVVTVLGPDQRYRYVNPYAEPDPAARVARVGLTFADHCAGRGLPTTLAVRRHRLFERAVGTRALVSWEEQWPGTAGSPAPLHWLCYYQPVFGPAGELRVVMCYGLDITSRHEAEARSRASEAAVAAQQAFTEQVLDLNPSVIYVRDARQRVVFENQAMQALTALIRARAVAPAPALDPTELAAFAADDARVRRGHEPLATEDRLTLSDGEVRWYQTVKCPLPTPGGEVHVLGVSTDITALKAAQLAAEAAATARENFLANMSHEIRTPLNGVLGMTGLLAKTALTEQQRNYADVIQHSGRHLLSVVNDVLDMAKITSGKLEFEQSAFNICDAMGRAVGPLMAQAQEKGIRVVGTLLRDSCPHPWVVGDPYRLNQVLLNLLSNAVKFTPTGGTVAIGGYLVQETADALTAEFRVTDTGIGIAADKLETIFQEFTQAYADTTRQFGGTGLGLSISRALVRQMGGTLAVDSTSGQGSSFSFVVTLPKASPAARKAAQAPAALPDAAALRGRRVLLVEDNAVNREVALLLLEGHGVRVDEADSGLRALALFGRRRYDAVLMDIQMPGMNGLEATARIRAHADPARAATPILALTANAFRADAEKYRAAGMNDTLPKPFDEAELLAKLAALVGTAAPRAPRKPRPVASSPPPTRPPARPRTPPKTPPTPLPSHPSTPKAPYDLTLLRETAHGSTAFVNRILAAFHANTPASVAELRAALAAADWPAAAALAHKLRPSLRLLGAAGLVPWLETLEAAGTDEAARRTAGAGLAVGLDELLATLPHEAAG